MDYNTEKYSKFIWDCVDKMGEIIQDNSLCVDTVKYNDTKIKSGIPVEPWFTHYTWNQSQEERFEKWFINEYCSRFRQNKRKGPYSGKAAFQMFNLQWGLKRNDVYLETEEE